MGLNKILQVHPVGVAFSTLVFASATVAVPAVAVPASAAPAPNAEAVIPTHAGSTGLDRAPNLPTGTYNNPAVFTVPVADQEDIFFEVDIPDGQRLHVGFSIDPATAPQDARISAQLMDSDGFLSSYVELDTENESTGEGLRNGFLRSEPMDPANRSWGRETVLRLRPQGTDYPVLVSAALIPTVVDGGGLEDVDRPALRYAEDLAMAPIDQAERYTLAARETMKMDIPVGWMQALDATVQITDPGSGDGSLSFALFNTSGEPMALVGDYEFSTQRIEPATFGQRAPAHYKNVSAKNKTRNTGFLGEYVTLSVTNTQTTPVSFNMALAVQGDEVLPGPVYDAEAAAQAAREVEPVKHDLYPAEGFEHPVWRQLLANPLVWVLIALIAAIIALVTVALRRR